MLEANARDALGDPAAAGRAAERALVWPDPTARCRCFCFTPHPACTSATPGTAP